MLLRRTSTLLESQISKVFGDIFSMFPITTGAELRGRRAFSTEPAPLVLSWLFIWKPCITSPMTHSSESYLKSVLFPSLTFKSGSLCWSDSSKRPSRLFPSRWLETKPKCSTCSWMIPSRWSEVRPASFQLLRLLQSSGKVKSQAQGQMEKEMRRWFDNRLK